MTKDFLRRNVIHWGNLLPPLFAILAFLEPSVHVYMQNHPHTFASILLGVLYAFYHSQPPRNSSRNSQNPTSS